MKSIRIGAGQGFWGNGSYGAANMVKTGNINYLCCDALAELTLAILKKGMQKNAYAGWVNELTGLLYACLPTCNGKGHQNRLQSRRSEPARRYGGSQARGPIPWNHRYQDRRGNRR